MGRSPVPILSIAAFICAGALLGVVGWLSHRQWQRAREADARLVCTLIVRTDITSLLELVEGAETGQRGYLITGDPSYLEPYQKAVRLLPKQTEELGSLIRNDAAQQAHLAQFNQLIAEKMSEMDETIQVRDTQGFDAASRIVRSNAGRNTMERIRAVISSMLDEEAHLYSQRQALSAQEGRRSTAFTFGTLLFALALVLGFGLLLVRQYRKLERTEGELQQSEQRFRLLVEGVQDYAILVMDPAGRVASWNAGAERIKGYRPEEIIGQHFSCFYPPADRESGKPERALEVAASEGQFQGEGWRIRKDGSQFWASVLITALRDSQNRLIGYSKIVRDLTARKQAEEALRRSERSLRYLSAKLLHVQDEERRRFASDLHDNAGQYLAMLKMRLDLLGSSSELDDGVRQKLEECTHLASETIKEVRATSYELYPPMLEEAGLRSAIPWFLEGFMERSGVTTRFEIPDGFSRPSRDVELALFRVLQESLTNVRRHSGSAIADVRLDIQDGIVRLEVADQGKGIPRAVLEAFDQGAMGKLGIGLRGMKERIRQLGGRLEISSNGEGTTITATVPVEQPS